MIALRRVMKRTIAIILALFYLGISTGATIHMHYCMGKLVDWGLWHSKSEQCSKCGMSAAKSKAHNCCKDEHQFVKLEKDQKVSESAVQLAQLSAVAVLPVLVTVPCTLRPTLVEQPLSHAPPLLRHKAIYLLHCVFRI
jgi:hypothetical protein